MTQASGRGSGRVALALFLLTTLALGVCFIVLRPFLAPLAWAVALAVAAYPVYHWLEKKLHSNGLAAGVAVFYFFRDSRQCVSTVRSLVPLARKEADHVLTRLRDTIHATVFGTVAISAIQGTLGGLMFWWLGLQSPVLWGVVMGLLAIVPVLSLTVALIDVWRRRTAGGETIEESLAVDSPEPAKTH